MDGTSPRQNEDIENRMGFGYHWMVFYTIAQVAKGYEEIEPGMDGGHQAVVIHLDGKSHIIIKGH